MRPGERPPAGDGGAGRSSALPDVIGLELSVALKRLERWRTTLRFTAPPKPRGEKGAVRVIACRPLGAGDALQLICAREYWERRDAVAAPTEPTDDAAADDGGQQDG
ncbi:MAG TPA: hypothetical protein VIK73_11045 [Limnochordales bacterium]